VSRTQPLPVVPELDITGTEAARVSRIPRNTLAAALPLADAAALAAAVTVTAIVAGQPGLLVGGCYAAVAFLALSASGLQRLRICLRLSDQAGRILAAVAAPAVVMLPWAAAGAALRLAALSAGLVFAIRWAGYAALRSARRSGHLTERVLLVGAGDTGQQVAGVLARHPELGLRACGFLDGSPLAGGLTLPVLGSPGDLAEVAARLGVGRAIVCFPDGGDEDLVPILRACRDLGTDICVVPRLHELGAALPRACVDEIWGIPVIPLRPGELGAGRFLKRAFDVAASAVLLVLTAPLLGALALVIKLRRRHPVLFRQVRVTGYGRQAEVIKLRTMGEHHDADTCWVVPENYLTPLGNFLRASHLDELPQLINVLRGDMSLVGPRPERPYFTEKFEREIPRYSDRHRMRAGLTGWAQIHGLHGDTSIHERVRFDNAYIDNWSLWLDVVILARTLASVAGTRHGGRKSTGRYPRLTAARC
jgi:exopolysaccharide biosynthesis polyprenyl glycosylphosphotransferase